MQRIIVFLILGFLPFSKILSHIEGEKILSEANHFSRISDVIISTEESKVSATIKSDSIPLKNSVTEGDSITLAEGDTSVLQDIIFSVASASEYIINLLGMDSVWRSSDDTIKLSIAKLIDHYHEPFDSVRDRLEKFDYNSIHPEVRRIVKRDTLPLMWLNDSTFIIESKILTRSPLITQKTIVIKTTEASPYLYKSTVPALEDLIEAIHEKKDTITELLIDSLYLKSLNIQLYSIHDQEITPSLLAPNSRKTLKFAADSSKIILSESFNVLMGSEQSPFYIIPGKGMPDSLRVAIDSLLAYTYERDSILLYINDIDGKKNPFWLTTGKDDLYRFWIKNSKNDSITIWIGNPSKGDLSLLLEEDVDLSRIEKKTADDIPITTLKPSRALIKTEPLKTIPVYWKWGITSSFILNQTHLSNWSKGGESSLASSLDISTMVNYTNTEAKTKWLNNARLRYGAIITDEHGLRKTTDILEFNSQYNKNLLNKIDFSTVFYMKHQIAKGYKYPNDSVVISKFLNPGTFTLGMGMEYIPNKNNSFNLSILSYKNTFVLDTARINQKAHGIDLDKRAKQEMGGQLLIKNIFNLKEDLSIVNTIRLFTNYFHKPENVDIDWEIDLSKRINWYFTVRLNLHMIYDDDILFPVLDKNNEPVLLPDGSKKMEPKIQFKEMLGLSLLFKI